MLTLSGSKLIQIAGTPMQCIEIYTEESYVIPFTFTQSGSPVNISSWTLTPSVKWYTATAAYPSATTIDISGLTAYNYSTQPAGLQAVILSGPAGTGYMTLPTGLTPVGYSFVLTDNPVLLAVITIEIERVDAVSSVTVINREPIGVIVRYQ